MSLKFLSKKKWHVKRLENIKKVAEAELKYKEEQTKILELQHEKEEERELEILRQIQIASGQIEPPKQRVEWLYKEPALKNINEEQPKSITNEKEPKEEADKTERNSRFKIADQNMLLREDPLFAVKNQKKQLNDFKKKNESDKEFPKHHKFKMKK